VNDKNVHQLHAPFKLNSSLTNQSTLDNFGYTTYHQRRRRRTSVDNVHSKINGLFQRSISMVSLSD